MKPLAFKPHLRVHVVDSTTVNVNGEHEHERLALSGRAYARLAPLLLAATHDEAALLAAVPPEVRPLAAQLALASLRARGLVAEIAGDHASPQSAYRAAAGVDPRATESALREQRVAVRALGRASAVATSEALHELFPRAAGEAEPASLHVLVVEDYLDAELAAWNAQALATGARWTLIKPVGASVWLGPLFVPGKSVCWECLASTLRAHRAVAGSAAAGAPSGAPPSLPATERVAAALLATELAKSALGSAHARIDGHVLTLDTLTMSLERHRVLARASCSVCGESARRAAQPNHAPMGNPTHPDESPEATLRRYAHLVSPISGVVHRLSRMSDEDEPLLHVYHATHLWPQTDERELDGAAAGRGRTDADARVSALCEALERYSGIFQGHEPRRRASFAELGADAIHPNALQLFSAAQFSNRDAWNRAHGLFHRVSMALDPNERIEWCPASSLTGAATRWVPAAHAYYGYADASVSYVCLADSNGNAAGHTRDDAIWRGLLELVERDAIAIWWYNRASRPGIDLASLNDSYVQQVEARLRARGRNLWLLDLTTDLGIPVCAALSAQCDAAVEAIALGFGAGLDLRSAASRAITEAIQVMHGAAGPSQGLAQWRQSATRANQPYLLPNDEAPVATRHPATHAAAALQQVVRTLARAEIDVLVLDQTRPEVGLPVVKVMAPGLRHFWARFAPGRLFDVPVQLGWRARALSESELNPIPFFL